MPIGPTPRVLGLVAGVLLAHLPAGVARAGETARVALRWSAPEGCPEAGRVTAEVDRLLGDRGARPPRPLQVSATVEQDAAGGFRVRLETAGEGGPRVRELKAASCAALADAAALILALAIDPSAVAVPPPSPAPAPVTPPPPVPAPAPVPVPSSAPGLRPRFHILGMVLADAGSLPGVSFAAGGAVAVSLARARLEIGAAGWPARAAVLANRPTRTGGDVSLVAGAASACYGLLAPGRFDLAPCAGMEVGRLHAEGFGVTTLGSGSVLWSAARVGGLFAWAPIAPIALVVRLEAVVPFARPTFVLENVGPVFRPGPVAGRAAGGVEARF